MMTQNEFDFTFCTGNCAEAARYEDLCLACQQEWLEFQESLAETEFYDYE